LLHQGTVGLLLTAGILAAAAARAEEKKTVQVTVLAILATDQNAKVDPRLKCIAQKVQKVRPALTGFRLKRTTSLSLEVGKEYQFALVDRQSVLVTVEHGADKKNRVGLAVKPPGFGEISYKCCCGKFLPIWTDYKTKGKETLLIAIMVEPCNEGCCQEKDEG
jgi:hypothetical protein